MLLRLRGPDGMARLTVEATDTFGDLGKQVCHVFLLMLVRLVPADVGHV